MREARRLTGAQPGSFGPDDLPGGRVALALAAAAWLFVVGCTLTHSIVLSSDSINNYVHVWWIARDLWHHARLPWRMPVLGHGKAFAYPYGFVNWTTAAVLRPVLGNWAVTLWSVLGALGCIAATFVAFPELRRGYWAAAVLANPAIVEALLFQQQTFAWAAALLLAAIAAWRRGHPAAAALLAGVAQVDHAAMLIPITLLTVALAMFLTGEHRALLRWYACSVVIAIPAAVLVFASPGYADASTSSRLVNFFATFGARLLVVVLPMAYVVIRWIGGRRLAPLALVVSLGFNIGLEIPLNVGYQWGALFRRPHHAAVDTYIASARFVPGLTYRVLRGAPDGKLRFYRVLLAGGRLDSELFPESMAIRNFRDTADYETLLCDRHVDRIVHDDSYEPSRHTNEHDMIDRLAAGAGSRVALRLEVRGPDYQVYDVDRSACTTGRAGGDARSTARA